MWDTRWLLLGWLIAVTAAEHADVALNGSIGCYEDTTAHVWDGQNVSTINTPQLCVKLCAGHVYAGAEASTQCYCGDTLPNTTLPQESCNKTCSGDSNYTCGGDLAMEVYIVPNTTQGRELAWVFGAKQNTTLDVSSLRMLFNGSYEHSASRIGCFMLFGGHHWMFEVYVHQYSVQNCIANCEGFNYAALTYVRCYCSWVLPDPNDLWPRLGPGFACTGGDGFDLYVASPYKQPSSTLDNQCIASIDSVDQRAVEYKSTASSDWGLEWGDATSMCLSQCRGCYMMWDFSTLQEEDKKLCGGAVVPYNVGLKTVPYAWDPMTRLVNGTSANISKEYAGTINLTSGAIAFIDPLKVFFDCVVCMKGSFISAIGSINTDPWTTRGYRVIFTSQQPAESARIEAELFAEVVRVLRVEEENLRVLNFSVDTNQRAVIHLRVMEDAFYQEEETEAKFKGFDVTRWWYAGVCLTETTTSPAGDVFVWNEVAPDSLQSHVIPGTQQLAERECKFNYSWDIQDGNWLNVEYFTVSWKPCNDTSAMNDIGKFLSPGQMYLGQDDYLSLILTQRANSTNVTRISLTKTSRIIDQILSLYYLSMWRFSTMLISDLIMDYDIFPTMETMIGNLVLEKDDSLLECGQGKYNGIIVASLQVEDIIGAEVTLDPKRSDYLNIHSTSDNIEAPTETDVKVTLQNSHRDADSRLAITTFVDYKTPLYRDYDSLDSHQYVIQVLISSVDKVATDSHGYVDVWVKNPSKESTKFRSCASWDFVNTFWSLVNCIPLRSPRSGLDVFRCSHLDTSNGTTRGYFKIYFHIPTFSDYLARNRNFEYMMYVNGGMSLFGVVSIFLTAIFYKNWCKDVGHRVLLLMVSALAVNIALGFMDLTVHVDTSSGLCIAFGAIRHFTFLAMFCWMLVMSGLQVKRLMTIVGAKDTSHLLLKISCFAWGVPLIPVTILLAWKKTGFYKATDNHSGSCYPSGDAFIVTVLTPAGAVLAVNFVVYLVVLNHIFDWIRCGDDVRVRRNTKDDRAMQLKRITTGIFIFFLFGFTWFFHFLSEVKLIRSDFLYEFLFLMTATVHVFILSLFFVIFDTDVRKYWRRCLC